MNTINVILSDNQLITRKGYLYILANHPGYNFVVTEVDSKEELIDTLQFQKPEIIITDPYLSDCNPVHYIKQLKMLAPESDLMVVSNRAVSDEISYILESGVNQYLLKNCDSQEIYLSLDAAVKCKKFLSCKIVDVLLDNYPLIPVKRNIKLQLLTETEREIVISISKGLSTREIALKRNLSPHTVNTHRKNILKKLRIRNSSELILYALQNDLPEKVEYNI